MTHLPNVSMIFYQAKREKNMFFAIFGHQMGSKSLENTGFWFAASNYPYLDTSTKTQLIRGAKRWPDMFSRHFLGKISG